VSAAAATTRTTAMPGHLANEAIPRSIRSATALDVLGLDLALATRNVERAHGDPTRFALAFAAGYHADLAMAREMAVTVVAVAAWRAGAMALRDDALARIEALPAEDVTSRRVVSAALGPAVDDLASFLERQRTDRFWWPGRAANRGYVCSVGGFAGLGGAWVAPPTRGFALSEPGAFGILAGDTWWRLDADVWGSRLTRLDDAPDPASDHSVSIVCQPTSYLAWVLVRDAA
jgi:hypothetical protein